MDLVSVLIPTYNQPEFFRKALKSALAQDYPNIEIIVSDDSTDDRIKLVYDEFSNTRFPIRYVSHSAERINSLTNSVNLLNLAQGEFINFLMHDDLFMPHKISTMMKYFSDNVAFVTSRRYLIDADDNVVGMLGIGKSDSEVMYFSTEDVGRSLLVNANNFVGEPTTAIFRKSDIYQNGKNIYGYFLEKLFTNHIDLQLWLELCRKKDSICIFIDEPLSAFRSNSAQATQDINVVFQEINEFASMISVAYLNDVFLHDVDSLDTSIQNWLKNSSKTIQSFEKINYDPKKFPYMDLLIDLMQSAKNKDYERFLELASLTNYLEV